MNKEQKIMQCHLCKEHCPQAETASEIASGRMFATKELIACQKELEAYRAIGTPEECREAVEKQVAKKPIIKYEQTQDCLTEIEWKCPTCEENYIELAPCGEWCRYCGTKLDWGEEK